MEPLVAMAGVRKSFGDTVVLGGVDFALQRGEVHALLGENGAGKSTLMNILAGIYAADDGTIRINGAAVDLRSPRDAQAAGIGMVHQHFRLVAAFTASENLLLAAAGRPDLRTIVQADARLTDLGKSTGLSVRTDVRVRDMSLAEQQRVEILRILALGARILILDEPTATLTDQESARLGEVVRQLAKQGLGIVLITHKLREVAAFCDRVSVMRAGRMVATGLPASEADRTMLGRLMVGEERDPDAPPARLSRTGGAECLRVEGLTTAPAAGAMALAGVDLTVAAGEIVGVAGVGGNGQEELAEALLGLLPTTSGTIRLHGVDVTGSSIWHRRAEGLRFVPADRKTWGLAGELSVARNLGLEAVREGRYGRTFLSLGRLQETARDAISRFGIAGATPRRPARLLSGGNAQKIVLARELDGAVRVLVVHSPTRGLDVAACRFVYDRLEEAAAAGAGILLISEDLEEIQALSDRILVMSRGRIVGTCAPGTPREAIGELMLGHA
ncbi:MAG: ATP-binding cassette domain-containing protein [Geminicoccaceae bacterium]